MNYDWVGFQIRNGGAQGARAAFEIVCAEAMSKQHPNWQLTTVLPAPGDEGIDFYLTPDGQPDHLPGIHAYQCKFFINTIDKSQKQQMKVSLEKAMRCNRFKLLTYTFMLPKEFSLEEEAWWNDFAQSAKEVHDIEVKVIKANRILEIGRDHNLLRFWFHETPPTTSVGNPQPLGTLLPPSIGKRYVEAAIRLSPIEQHFGQPQKVSDLHPQPLVLAGPPGVGKTRLAIEYAHKIHTAYKTQIKLPVDTKANLDSAIERLSRDPRLAIAFNPLLDKDNLNHIVLAQLSTLTSEGLLLILDGANSQESLAVVRDFLRALGGAHAIVTSQIRRWGLDFNVIEVTPLTVDGASCFLLNELPSSRITKQEAEELAQQLGCVPLAIEIALAYCEDNLCNASDYLFLLKTKTAETLQFSDFDGTVDYPQSLSAALVAAWDRVEEIDPWASTILTISAFYGQAPIPLSFWDREEIAIDCSHFLVDFCGKTSIQTLMAEYGQPNPRKSIALLQKYCQVNFSTEDDFECYSVPSLIRIALRCRYAKDALGLAIMLTQPFNSLQKHLLIDEQHPTTWTVWSFLRPHVESVLSDLINNKFVWPTVLLAERLASWYSACGFNKRARAILSQVFNMEIEAWASGPSEWQELAAFGVPNQGSIFLMHACTFSRVLLKETAVSDAQSVLQMCESLVPNATPRLQARWFAHLGDCLFAEHEHEKAQHVYTRAIEIEKKQNGSHYDIILCVYLRKLAATQIAMSEFGSSEEMLREAIQIGSRWRLAKYRSTVLGSELINNAVLRSVNLADDWHSTSDQDRRVVFTRPRWLGGRYGRFTPELAQVLCTFAELRLAQQRFSEARLLLDGSLAICWYSLGPLASLTAEVWTKRREISIDGEQFASSYPDWVLGLLVSEFQMISTGGRPRHARCR
jgi:hypothetical protein